MVRIEAEIRIDDELTNKTISDVGLEIPHTVKSNFTIIGKTTSQMQLCINRITFGMTKLLHLPVMHADLL